MAYFCAVKQEEIIKGFVQLGSLMRALGRNEEWSDFSLGLTQEEYHDLNALIPQQFHSNGWFVEKNVRQSLLALGELLNSDSLARWVENYTFSSTPKKVGVIMAGNIPLVGFHDFLCVLISGNHALCKLSSNDKSLLPALSKHLVNFVPSLGNCIEFTESRMNGMEAIIATGSDNSLQYFEQYFGKYPNVFRRNRTSLAILDGKESNVDLENLGSDIFNYFGLGCRNVSHLLIPEDYDLQQFFQAIVGHSEVVNNNKYANNYDYNKAVYLMNQHALLDNNFVLLRESADLFSPLSMIHYHYYKSQKEIESYLNTHKENLQVIVGKNYTPFGKSQSPGLSDYADGVDLMEWLADL